jgi:hypothetical protein
MFMKAGFASGLTTRLQVRLPGARGPSIRLAYSLVDLQSPKRSSEVGSMNRALVAIAVMFSAIAISPAAHADDLECDGAVEGGNFDNVIVPAGAVCYLNVANVKGNVDVEEDAIFISACSTVGGNVTADGAADVVVSCSSIGGRVQVVRGGELSVDSSAVTGDVVFTENAGQVEIIDNVIQGSVQAHMNTGGVTMADNRIRNNLQCSQNNPRPVGRTNRVGGTKSGQCRRI